MNITIKCGDEQITIESKDCLKILGMKVDSHLTWRNHIAQIRSRTTNVIRHISRSNATLSLSSRILLTNALVVPHYNYGDIIYDGCTADAREILKRNQNYAAKALLGKSKYSSATDALVKLRWIPLHMRRKIHQGVFVHKAIHHQSSVHATSSILNLTPQHGFSTRFKQDNRLNSIQHTTALSEKSVISASTQAWNSFPQHFRSIESANVFKEKLQKFYIDNYINDRCHVGQP